MGCSFLFSYNSNSYLPIITRYSGYIYNRQQNLNSLKSVPIVLNNSQPIISIFSCHVTFTTVTKSHTHPLFVVKKQYIT